LYNMSHALRVAHLTIWLVIVMDMQSAFLGAAPITNTAMDRLVNQ